MVLRGVGEYAVTMKLLDLPLPSRTVSARRTHLERSGIAREDSVHQDSQVDTMEAKRIRRTHGAELKAAVVDACRQPGASIAAVAL